MSYDLHCSSSFVFWSNLISKILFRKSYFQFSSLTVSAAQFAIWISQCTKQDGRFSFKYRLQDYEVILYNSSVAVIYCYMDKISMVEITGIQACVISLVSVFLPHMNFEINCVNKIFSILSLVSTCVLFWEWEQTLYCFICQCLTAVISEFHERERE